MPVLPGLDSLAHFYLSLTRFALQQNSALKGAAWRSANISELLCAGAASRCLLTIPTKNGLSE